MLLVSYLFALLARGSDDTNQKQVALPVSVARNSLYREFAAVQSARDKHSKALHLYLLNDAADQYAYSLDEESIRSTKSGRDLHASERDTELKVQDANHHGAAIQLCEFSRSWTDGSQGYLDYLSLWPKGPLAEEAWWRGRFPNHNNQFNSCYDGAGSEEETNYFIRLYSDFLHHFPHGNHAKQARESLKEFQSDLEWYKGQKAGK